MNRPHSNNCNNVVVAGAQFDPHPSQLPHKVMSNGVPENSENACVSVDQGYSSVDRESSFENHFRCNPKSPHHVGQFPMPGSVANGPLTIEPNYTVGPRQRTLQNGHLDLQTSPRYPVQGELKHSLGSGEALDDNQGQGPNLNGQLLTSSSLNGYQDHLQNGYPDRSPTHICSAQSSPFNFSYSGEAVEEAQRQDPFTSGPPLTPNSQKCYNSQMHNGPTSPRPPPVIRKHSSFTRQNAIEEEVDDHDELNDSGFGSMCRTTSYEKPRRSRSRDVSDAPTEEVNNNLAPRKLQRSQSSQERTDNELAQFHNEKRRCSSEQLQRSNGSSGYHSAINGVQEDLARAFITEFSNLAKGTSAKSVTSTAHSPTSVDDVDDDKDIYIGEVFRGLRDTLSACEAESWEAEEVHKEILSHPNSIMEQFLASEAYDQQKELISMEVFRRKDCQNCEPSSPTLFNGNLVHSSSTQSDKINVDMPETSSELLISPEESTQTQDDIAVPIQVSREVTTDHADILDDETKENLQTILEERAYCEEMKHNTCLKCSKTGVHLKIFEKCYRSGKLDQCDHCKEMVKAYQNHSKNCESYRCVLPFCGYIKDLFNETGLLHNLDMRRWEGVLGCLKVKQEVDVLERLHELRKLHYPSDDGVELWSYDDNAESYLRSGQPYSHLTTEGRLCKFGHFTPIRCKARRREQKGVSVVIKKVRWCSSLTSTLQKLHAKSSPSLKDIISTCLWYQKLTEEKLLICSTYLCEKSLSSSLKFSKETRENYWKEACKAAVKLHESKILYLNWKVDHLVVTHDDSVKLCNLDYAVDITCSSSDGDLRGSLSEDWRGSDVPERVKKGLDPRIAPPEVLDGRGLSMKSDTWGLGCLLYQLYNGECLPYLELSHLSDDAIREERLRVDERHSELVQDSMMTSFLSEICWKHQPIDRKLPGELGKCLQDYNDFEISDRENRLML